jgi:hypothetical protein
MYPIETLQKNSVIVQSSACFIIIKSLRYERGRRRERAAATAGVRERGAREGARGL